MATSLDGTRRWLGRDVRIPEVSRRLREMRAEAGGDLHSTLTSVMNLVVWAPAADAAGVEDVADGLRDHHPSRVVIVVPEAGGDRIDARIDVMSHPDRPGGRTLQVEQIVLRLGGLVGAHAASAVIPLLRPDLPTFLWWPTAPEPTAPLFRELGRIAERVVAETGRGLRGAAAVERLHHAVRVSSTPITDLAWAVITPWRQLLATSARGDLLERLRAGACAVAVTCSAGEPPLEALLLAGWLGDVLGDAARVAFYDAPGDGLLGVRIEAGGACVLELIRDSDRPTVTVTTAAGGARCVPLPASGRRELLAGELELRGRDRPFEREVARAIALAGRPPDDPTGARAGS